MPDALEPWDGSERATERPNQPVHVQVDVPYGTRPGRYTASLAVTADGRRTVVPVRIAVFPVTLPRPGTRVGNLLTSFNLSPESYVAKAAQLYRFSNHDQRIAANRALFAAARRVPRLARLVGLRRAARGRRDTSRAPGGGSTPQGTSSGSCARRPGFSALRIPISSNRTSARNYIAQMSPFSPETWCEYLGRVRSFWAENDVLGAAPLPYLFGYDEPSLDGPTTRRPPGEGPARLLPRRGQQLMTGNPTPANAFLWDGKGGDDLDVWTLLSRRYYGTWTSPVDTSGGHVPCPRLPRADRQGAGAGKDGVGVHVHRNAGHPGVRRD